MKKWKVANEKVTAHIRGVEARFLSVETEDEMVAGGGVALVHEHPNKVGNAAMIAAVPDMLDAIRATLAAWAPCVDDPNYAAQEAAQQKLVDALKKAGVTP